MFCRAANLALTLLFATALTVSAQEPIAAIPQAATTLSEAVARASTADAGQAGQAGLAPTTLWSMSQAPKKRPTMLPVLYGTYGMLAAADIVSTKKAINNGAYEANPLAKGGNLGSTIAIKAGTGAATFFAAEKLWKKSRVGAIALMVAANSLSAVVVSHNLQNARR
jgi:hypothetical protein